MIGGITMAEHTPNQEQGDNGADWRDGQLGQQLVDLLEESYRTPPESE